MPLTHSFAYVVSVLMFSLSHIAFLILLIFLSAFLTALHKLSRLNTLYLQQLSLCRGSRVIDSVGHWRRALFKDTSPSLSMNDYYQSNPSSFSLARVK